MARPAARDQVEILSDRQNSDRHKFSRVTAAWQTLAQDPVRLSAEVERPQAGRVTGDIVNKEVLNARPCKLSPPGDVGLSHWESSIRDALRGAPISNWQLSILNFFSHVS